MLARDSVSIIQATRAIGCRPVDYNVSQILRSVCVAYLSKHGPIRYEPSPVAVLLFLPVRYVMRFDFLGSCLLEWLILSKRPI